MGTSLVLHCGARQVDAQEIHSVPVPAGTNSWFPVGHGQVLEVAQKTLQDCGYVVMSSKLGLSRDDQRFFGVLNLGHALATGVNLAVGIRNSIDKSFPMGLVAGSHVFVCDNLSFRSDLIVRRRHTRFGRERFVTDIADAVSRLGQFHLAEQQRIRVFQHKEISDQTAESLLLKSYELGIVSARYLPSAIREWRCPSYDEFRDQGKTLWVLEQAFTTALGDVAKRNPAGYAATTMRLATLLTANSGLSPEEAQFTVSA